MLSLLLDTHLLDILEERKLNLLEMFNAEMLPVLILATVTLLVFFIFTRNSKRNRRVPGLAKRDKIHGNLGDIHAAGGFLPFLKQLHKQFGPIASYWQGDVLTVSIAHPQYYKATEKMFDRHPALFKVSRWGYSLVT